MLNVVVRSLCVILIGVLMVVMRETFMPLIIQFIGAAFVVSGAISLFNIYILRRRGFSRPFDSAVLAVVGVAGVALGLWLLLSPAFFLSLLMLLLGLLLLFIGFYQLVTLLSAQSRMRMPVFMYVVPLLLLVAGVVVLIDPFEVVGLPFLIIGVSAIFSGLSDLITYFYIARRSRSVK
jgi:uncharacterized membrane protein HdeD (DUF308 family)